MNSDSRDWCPPPGKPVLDEGSVHVWQSKLAATTAEIDEYLALLSADERTRARRFHFDKDRNRYIIRRSVLRKLIAGYIDEAPTAIRFEYNEYGKPRLCAEHNSNLHFNLSFSDELSLFAFSRNQSIGIDIEIHDTGISAIEIAEQYFSAAESEALLALATDQQHSAFYNCWTRKEAWIKARGKGLSIPLDSFAVSLAPGEAARLVSVENNPEAGCHWSMFTLEPAPEYTAALAVEGQCQSPRLFTWTPASM